MGTSQRAATGRRPSGEALDGATLLLVLALIVLAAAIVIGAVTRDGPSTISKAAAGTVATDPPGFPRLPLN